MFSPIANPIPTWLPQSRLKGLSSCLLSRVIDKDIPLFRHMYKTPCCAKTQLKRSRLGPRLYYLIFCSPFTHNPKTVFRFFVSIIVGEDWSLKDLDNLKIPPCSFNA